MKSLLGRINTFWKSSKKGKFVLILVSTILILCFCCLGLLIWFGIETSSPTYKATSTAKAAITQTFEANFTKTPLPSITHTLASNTPFPTNTIKITNTSSPNNTTSPTITPSPTLIAKLIVPTGKLEQYRETYSNYLEVFVTKKDGTVDPRPNDLEELWLDWFYYRDKIIEYVRAGDSIKADEARAAFNQINGWMDEYDENDVQTMLSIIEDR